MRWKRVAWAGCLAPVLGGCHPALHGARDLVAEKAVTRTEAGIERRIHAHAREAWRAVRDQYPRKVFTAEFRDGFLDGYADYLDRGGDAQPPAVPPARYTTNKKYFTPEGHALIRDYFLGFQYGTEVAVATGQRQYLTVPVLVPDAVEPVPPVVVAEPVDPFAPTIPAMPVPPPALLPPAPVPPAPSPVPLPRPKPVPGSDAPVPKVPPVPATPAVPPVPPPVSGIPGFYQPAWGDLPIGKPAAALPVPRKLPGKGAGVPPAEQKVSKFGWGSVPVSKETASEPALPPIPTVQPVSVPGSMSLPTAPMPVKLPEPPPEVPTLPPHVPTPPMTDDLPVLPPNHTVSPPLPFQPDPVRE